MSAISLGLDTPDLARRYDERSVRQQFQHGKELLASLDIHPGNWILDVGTGTGLLAEHAADLVGSEGYVLGIDPLAARIEIAAQRARKNLQFSARGAYPLQDIPSGSFDVVYFNQVIHWVPDQRQALQEAFRVLKAGGRIGITSMSRDHIGPVQLIRRRVLAGEPYRAYQQTQDGSGRWLRVSEAAHLIEDTGFDVRKIELQDNVFFQPNPIAAIEFAEASSFGNYLGHLPEELKKRAFEEIQLHLEQLRTPQGIRIENKRLVVIGRKPVTN